MVWWGAEIWLQRSRVRAIAGLGLTWSVLGACSSGVQGGGSPFEVVPTSDDSTSTSEGSEESLGTESISASGEGEGSGSDSDPGSTSNADSSAPAMCGDGVAEGDESCDGDDLLQMSCADFEYEGGVLACGPQCMLITDACFTCGDGVKGLPEACDMQDFGGATCESEGFASGTLSCSSDCMSLVTSGCTPLPGCGDGIRNGAEQCDGADLNGSTCVAQGFDVGSLACNPVSCTYDTSGCDLLECSGQGEFCLFSETNPQSTCCPAGVAGNILGLCAAAICV